MSSMKDWLPDSWQRREALQQPTYEDPKEVRDARDRVTDGATISKPLAEGKIFPPLLTDMLAIGEETGDMSGSLEHIANRYDDELDRNVKIFTSVLEPILILAMAVMVGFIAISMLMAVFDLTSGLNV